MRLVVLTILLSLTIWSCGSRKVNRVKSINQVELQQQKEVANDIQLQAVDKIVQRFKKSEMKFSAAEISIAPDGSVSIKEPVIENKATEEATEVQSKLDIVDQTKVEEKASESLLEKENVKEVEREQFNWWWVIFFISICGVVFGLLKKYKLI